MVAIHIPRRGERDWSAGPAARPPGALSLLDARPPVLPDRATRVRRRRLALLVVAALLAASTALGVQALSGLAEVGGTTEPTPVDVRSRPSAGQRYVVQPGDTLWTIAAQIAPDDDPRVVVDALTAANGGPDLQVGTELVLDVE
jgi:hypothetical protein